MIPKVNAFVKQHWVIQHLKVKIRVKVVKGDII